MQTLLLILDLQIPKFASPWLGPRVRMVCLCRLQDVLRSLGSLGTRGLGTRTLKTHEAVTAGLRSFIWPAWRKPMIWNRNSAWKHRKPATSTTLRGLKANTASSKRDSAQKVGTGAEKSLFFGFRIRQFVTTNYLQWFSKKITRTVISTYMILRGIL